MKRTLSLFILFLFLAGFVFGLAWICDLRFERGDIYPRYSSLRSDPFGTKGLYESLQALPELEVTRNYRPLNQVDLPSRTTWIIAGIQANMNDSLLDKARAGARVVLCYDRQKRVKDKNKNTDPHCDITFDSLKATGDLIAHKQDAAPAELTESMPWLDTRTITPDQNDWQVVYTVENEAVVLERSYGQGTLVVLAHSYLLSNEALLTQRQTALILWLCGPNRSIVFDETVHRINETQGIMSLAREFRLQGLALGALCVTILFVWSRTQILTRPSESAVGHVLQGRSLESGLSNLLERHTPKSELLATCYAEWAASLNTQPSLEQRLKHTLPEIERLARATTPDQAVTQYNLVTEMISKKDDYDTRTRTI
jgi:hypothetical protein